MKFSAFLMALFLIAGAFTCTAQTTTTTTDGLVWYTEFSKAQAAAAEAKKTHFWVLYR